jgi:hypothetical protein
MVLPGGFAPAALRRVERHADGFICAAPRSWAGSLVGTVHEEWEVAGRASRPRLVPLSSPRARAPATMHETDLTQVSAGTGRSRSMRSWRR